MNEEQLRQALRAAVHKWVDHIMLDSGRLESNPESFTMHVHWEGVDDDGATVFSANSECLQRQDL